MPPGESESAPWTSVLLVPSPQLRQFRSGILRVALINTHVVSTRTAPSHEDSPAIPCRNSRAFPRFIVTKSHISSGSRMSRTCVRAPSLHAPPPGADRFNVPDIACAATHGRGIRFPGRDSGFRNQMSALLIRACRDQYDQMRPGATTLSTLAAFLWPPYITSSRSSRPPSPPCARRPHHHPRPRAHTAAMYDEFTVTGSLESIEVRPTLRDVVRAC